jgi:peptidase M28-like protein
VTTVLAGAVPAPPLERLRRQVAELASIHRPSASEGERRAAEWVADRMRAHGAPARVETERAHGGYWGPLTMLSLAGVLGALAGGRSRLAGAALAGAAAAGVWDDISGGGHHARRLLPHRDAFNVVAEMGPEDAARTVVLVAHHDAAKSGLIFHPGIPAFVWRRYPALIQRNDTSPPLMFPVFGGPALAALGSLAGNRVARIAGGVISAGAAAVIGQIGSTNVVPGANDNATGVVSLLELARRLAEQPTANVRVLLVSTGSEESFMEGMQAFMRRHGPALPQRDTFVLAVDTVGSPHLTAIRGEGMLVMNDYPRECLDLVDRAAADLDISLFPNLRLRNATDGLIALKQGYPCACLGSVTEYKAPANYHWRTDTPENVDYGTLADAVRLCETVVRRLDERWLVQSA